MPSLRTGELARLARVNVETLRFYERQGLLPEPPRGVSGYRDYPPETVALVLFIQRAQHLGFSLREIKELLALRVDPDTTCAEVRSRAEAKLAEVDAKIEALQRMKRALKKLTTACSGRGPISDCPILEALEPERVARTDSRIEL